MQRLIALLLLLCACGPAFQASAAVVITLDDTLAQVSDSSTYDGDDQFNTGGTLAVATILPSYSSATTSLFNSAIMSASFVQSRGGNLEGYSDGYVASYFTPDANMSYTAVGSYSNSGGVTYFASQLYDATADVVLFESIQESNGVAAAFTLGGLAGNTTNNYWEGSLTGTLLADHNYEWWSDAYTFAGYDADGGATASGEVSLTFGTAAVPEASSLIVWSLLALTIGGAGRWQRS